MIEFGEAIKFILADRTQEEFNRNPEMRLALVHLVQNIGEAATKISSETRDKYPHIP